MYGPHLLPQHFVQAPRHRVRERKEKDDEDPHYGDASRAYVQAVAGAARLGYDLSEDDDERRREEEAGRAAEDVRGEDGEHGVHGHVAEQEGAEEEVAVLADGENFFGAFSGASGECVGFWGEFVFVFVFVFVFLCGCAVVEVGVYVTM